MHEHWRHREAEHKPGRQSRDHSPALRLRHPETGLLEPSTLLRPGQQHRTGRGLGQALPSPRRVPGHRGAGRPDPGVDPLADARRQQEIGTPRFGRPTGDWDLIHGELVTFTDPQRDLPPIDRLEGFRPGGHSMYQRVMVVAARGSIACAVWTYTMYAPQNGHRVTNDNQAVFWKSRH